MVGGDPGKVSATQGSTTKTHESSYRRPGCWTDQSYCGGRSSDMNEDVVTATVDVFTLRNIAPIATGFAFGGIPGALGMGIWSGGIFRIARGVSQQDNPVEFTENDIQTIVKAMNWGNPNTSRVLHADFAKGALVKQPRSPSTDRNDADRLRTLRATVKLDGTLAEQDAKWNALIIATERRAEKGWRDYTKGGVAGGLTLGATVGGLLSTGWIFRTWKTFGDLGAIIRGTFTLAKSAPETAIKLGKAGSSIGASAAAAGLELFGVFLKPMCDVDNSQELCKTTGVGNDA